MAQTLGNAELLALLQGLEEDSSQYTFGTLRAQRDRAVKDYFQRPYGNEEEGWSQIVTSDVQDTIEWMMPALLEKFVSSDDAVVFDPSRASDAEGAEQATDACNYVFYKQNNGFLILYTAFKDALQVKNCAINWRKETKEVVEKLPLRGVPAEMIAYHLSQGWEQKEDAEALPQQEPQIMQTPQGPMVVAPPQTYNALLTKTVERKTIKVEAFEPETLQVKRDWTSPMLEDCPYVCRSLYVSLSDLKMMGFEDVTAEELAGSAQTGIGMDQESRRTRTGDQDDVSFTERNEVDTDDESQTMGYLRIEWVLADKDGDGIAERLEVYRLEDKILSVEECPQVPVATGSPILVQHRWDGMSVAEIVADIQRLRTDLMRGVVNNAALANNPRNTVLTDANGAPRANVDDLLDSRPGGLLRQFQPDAIGTQETPFVGQQMFGMMEYIDLMREQRTGVSKNQQGLDPNSLRPDRTAKEVQLTTNAANRRIDLVARIFAETLVKPMFKGILRLLTEGDMDKIAFRLRGKFVEYDPNEWRDSYDMTINVGTGTGDKEKQLAVLAAVGQEQLTLAGSPLGPMVVTPRQIYKTKAKMLDLAGFKNVDDFWTDPQDAKLPTPPPPPPDPKIQIEQMKLQAEAQKFQAESQQEYAKLQLEDQRKQRELMAQNEIQRQNDERDAQAKLLEAQYKQELELAKLSQERYKTDEDNRVKIIVAQIAHPGENGVEVAEDGTVTQKPDPMLAVLAGLAELKESNLRPKVIELRDSTGKVTKSGVVASVQ
jgi:hypothetical protein